MTADTGALQADAYRDALALIRAAAAGDREGMLAVFAACDAGLTMNSLIQMIGVMLDGLGIDADELCQAGLATLNNG